MHRLNLDESRILKRFVSLLLLKELECPFSIVLVAKLTVNICQLKKNMVFLFQPGQIDQILSVRKMS